MLHMLFASFTHASPSSSCITWGWTFVLIRSLALQLVAGFQVAKSAE